MGIRREARECAVQFLFEHDLNRSDDLEAALGVFWEDRHAGSIPEVVKRRALRRGEDLPPLTSNETATRLFADPLIRGVVKNRDRLDERIRQHAKNWDLHRIATVDRNVLRLAIYEMLFREDIPPVVSINEAVDIAKRFSTEDSGKFVNGILDKIRSELLRPARTAQ